MLPSNSVLREYQQAALQTAIYPAALAMVYPALGLAGETGEYLSARKNGMPPPDLHKELGDVCWYTSVLASDLGFPLEGLETPAPAGAEMFTVVAAIAEQVKKLVRDTDGAVEGDRQERLRSLLGQLLHLLDREAAGLGTDLAAIMSINIDKLASRAVRGQLHGDGDHR